MQTQGAQKSKSKITRRNLVAQMLFSLSSHLRLRTINRSNPDGTTSPYLERYCVTRSRFLTIYLHRYVDKDQDTEVHDHPWPFLSFVLCGAYEEVRLKNMIRTSRWIRWVNVVGSNTHHLVREAKPETWTLLIHGPRTVVNGEAKHFGFVGEITEGQANFRPGIPTDPNWHRRNPRGGNSQRVPFVFSASR